MEESSTGSRDSLWSVALMMMMMMMIFSQEVGEYENNYIKILFCNQGNKVLYILLRETIMPKTQEKPTLNHGLQFVFLTSERLDPKKFFPAYNIRNLQ